MRRFSLVRGSVGVLVLALYHVASGLAYKRSVGVLSGRRKLGVGWHPPSNGKGKSNTDDEFGDGWYEEGDDDDDNIFDHNSRTQIESEDAFVAYCQSSLLSVGATSDGLISQTDVAEFISDLCDIFDHESIPEFRCPTPQFANVDIKIQLSFVWYICPNDDQVSTLTCLGNLGVEQNEFGYSITPEDYQTSVDSVLGFCCSLLPFLERTGIAPLSSLSVCPPSLPVIDMGGSPAPGARPTRQPTPPSVPSSTTMPVPSTTVVPSPASGPALMPVPSTNVVPSPVSGPTPMPVPSTTVVPSPVSGPTLMPVPSTNAVPSPVSGPTLMPIPSTTVVPSPVSGPTLMPVPSTTVVPSPLSGPTLMPFPSTSLLPTPRPTPAQNGIPGSDPPSPQTNGQPTSTPATEPQPVGIPNGSEGEQPVDPGTGDTLSVGGTVGIVLGSAAFVMAFALAFARRRRKPEE